MTTEPAGSLSFSDYDEIITTITGEVPVWFFKFRRPMEEYFLLCRNSDDPHFEDCEWTLRANFWSSDTGADWFLAANAYRFGKWTLEDATLFANAQKPRITLKTPDILPILKQQDPAALYAALYPTVDLQLFNEDVEQQYMTLLAAWLMNLNIAPSNTLVISLQNAEVVRSCLEWVDSEGQTGYDRLLQSEGCQMLHESVSVKIGYQLYTTMLNSRMDIEALANSKHLLIAQIEPLLDDMLKHGFVKCTKTGKWSGCKRGIQQVKDYFGVDRLWRITSAVEVIHLVDVIDRSTDRRYVVPVPPRDDDRVPMQTVEQARAWLSYATADDYVPVVET